MNVRLLGYKDVDFVSRDGKQVKGKKIYTASKDEGVVGEMSDSFFLADGFELPALRIGQELTISFNRHGKPEQITALPEPQKAININKQ